MSLNKLGAILFSGFLILATAPLAHAQNTSNQDTTTTKKQTQKKSTASKEQSKTGDQSTSSSQSSTTSTSAKSKSVTSDKNTTGDQEKSTAKKKKQTKKSSSVSPDKVRQMQSALKKEGFYTGPVDGQVGLMTMNAIRNYQLWNHLEATGKPNAETENALINGATAGKIGRAHV